MPKIVLCTGNVFRRSDNKHFFVHIYPLPCRNSQHISCAKKWNLSSMENFPPKNPLNLIFGQSGPVCAASVQFAQCRSHPAYNYAYDYAYGDRLARLATCVHVRRLLQSGFIQKTRDEIQEHSRTYFSARILHIFENIIPPKKQL